jgi:hypothetical protein
VSCTQFDQPAIYLFSGLGVGEGFCGLSVLGASAFFHSDKGRWTAFLKSNGTSSTGKFWAEF